MGTTSPKSRSQVALEKGFCSGLEADLADQISGAGLPVYYELIRIPYRVEKDCTYRPDFVLPNGIVIESKGRFVTPDRQKHLLILEQHPGIDLRFVFDRSACRISKTSKTTYAKWCKSRGFQFADKWVPEAWINEPRNDASWSALRAAFTGTEWPFP